MPYLYLLLTVFLSSSTSIFGKFYNIKNKEYKDPISIYNLIFITSVLITWGIIYFIDFSFNLNVLIYSFLFGLFFVLANIGTINAIKNGPVSISTLFINLSLIVTSIWGLLFWNSPFKITTLVGLLLASISMFLCIFEKGENAKASIKWILFVLLSFLGNAGCAIVQKTQQIVFNGEYGKMTMFFATLVSSIFFLIVFIVKKKENLKDIVRNKWYFPLLAGVGNALLNTFVIILASTSLSPSLIYPTIGVGGLIFVLIISIFVFKEKIKLVKWIGIVIGIISTILLAL